MPECKGENQICRQRRLALFPMVVGEQILTDCVIVNFFSFSDSAEMAFFNLTKSAMMAMETTEMDVLATVQLKPIQLVAKQDNHKYSSFCKQTVIHTTKTSCTFLR
jgi:hypothetical protein